MATAAGAKRRPLGTTVRDGVIAVEVGPARMKHFVHKALLEEHSEYFKKALNGSWKEAEEKAVCLDDVDCSTFEVSVEWLYTRKLPATDEAWTEKEEEDQTANVTLWHTAVQIAMIKTYAFADRLLSPDLHQALENKLIDYYIVAQNVPYYGAVIYAFAHLPPTSPVLRVIMDAHSYNSAEASDTEEHGEMQLRAQLPNAFLVGVMVRYGQLKSKKNVELDRCNYHQHVTEDEEHKCREAALLAAAKSEAKSRLVLDLPTPAPAAPAPALPRATRAVTRRTATVATSIRRT